MTLLFSMRKLKRGKLTSGYDTLLSFESTMKSLFLDGSCRIADIAEFILI